MVVEARTPYPVQALEAAALEILPSSAGRVLDSGPAKSNTGGQGELVVTSFGLVACDLRSGECAGVDWHDFDPAVDVTSEGDTSTVRLHFPGFDPVEFTIDTRLAANIVALNPFDATTPGPTGHAEARAEDEHEDDLRDQKPLPAWATMASPPDDDLEPAAPLFRRSWFWAGTAALLIAAVTTWTLVALTSDDGSIEIAALGDDGTAGGIRSSDIIGASTVGSSTTTSITAQATTTTAVASPSQRLTLPTVATPTSLPKQSTSQTTTTEATTTTASTSVPVEGDCHPAYEGCIPYHAGDALDCSDIDTNGGAVRLREIGIDPYNLDDDEDGVACEATD